DPRGIQALESLYPFTGSAHIVGITGPPGVGKSSLTAAAIAKVRAGDRRIAVLAIDPTSPVSGGAVLGDRVRMMDFHADNDVFIRSMASRGRHGGLAWTTAELVHLLDAAGFPLIVIETVGTGQDSTDIAHLADTVVVVEAPGLGDGIQAIKSGLLEVGDVVVVNKADHPGASDALRSLRGALADGSLAGSGFPRILGTDALTGKGVDSLVHAIDEHARWLNDSGERERRRERGIRAEVLAGVRARLARRMDSGPSGSPELAHLLKQVQLRKITPRRAIETIVGTADCLSGRGS
ncbi:MAG: methylmalonyl Co-A mutase-associated GTPase MeaB, partial [Thermomicrobiales bacterium]